MSLNQMTPHPQLVWWTQKLPYFRGMCFYRWPLESGEGVSWKQHSLVQVSELWKSLKALPPKFFPCLFWWLEKEWTHPKDDEIFLPYWFIRHSSKKPPPLLWGGNKWLAPSPFGKKIVLGSNKTKLPMINYHSSAFSAACSPIHTVQYFMESYV